jgi:hypothetical protein
LGNALFVCHQTPPPPPLTFHATPFVLIYDSNKAALYSL